MQRRVQQLRVALIDAVTDQDMRDVLAALLQEARDGNVAAIREFYDRMLGRPDQSHKIVGVLGTNAMTPEQIAEVILSGRAGLPAE